MSINYQIIEVPKMSIVMESENAEVDVESQVQEETTIHPTEVSVADLKQKWMQIVQAREENQTTFTRRDEMAGESKLASKPQFRQRRHEVHQAPKEVLQVADETPVSDDAIEESKATVSQLREKFARKWEESTLQRMKSNVSYRPGKVAGTENDTLKKFRDNAVIKTFTKRVSEMPSPQLLPARKSTQVTDETPVSDDAIEESKPMTVSQIREKFARKLEESAVSQMMSNVSYRPGKITATENDLLKKFREGAVKTITRRASESQSSPSQVFQARRNAQVTNETPEGVVIEGGKTSVSELKEKFAQKWEENVVNQMKWNLRHRHGETAETVCDVLKKSREEAAKALAKSFGFALQTTINEKPVSFTADGNSDYTILNIADHRKIGTVRLRFTKYQLSGRDSKSSVRGSCNLTITYNGIPYNNQCVIVADIRGKSIIGTHLLRRIQDNASAEM